MPARDTAPVVAVAGVKPVLPPENDKTPVLAKVTLPVELETLIPEPAIADKTPVLAIVTLPVAPDTEMPELAILLKTPVFATVIKPAPFVTLIPEDGVKVCNE